MNKTFRLIVGILALVSVLALAGLAYSSLQDKVSPDTITLPATETAQREAAPDFAVTTADGRTERLSDMKGKPVVLNFWASWCSPCKIEMPAFEAVYQELGDDVLFMMVNLTDGSRETLDTASAFLAAQGYTFPVYFDTLGQGAAAYGIFNIPTTLFIDSQGNLVRRIQGPLNESSLRSAIAEARN